MEDVLKFLLIAGVIIIGIVKQFKKEAKKNADKKPVMPMPQPEATTMDEPTSLPENWGKTYGGYIPEGPPSENVMPVEKKKSIQKNSSSSKSFLPGTATERGSRFTDNSSKQKISPPATADPQAPEPTSEYSIHSAEEARRAIIWSEILQRKF